MGSAFLAVVINGMLLGLLYALFATGLTVSFGVMRVFNVAYGALMTLVVIEVCRLPDDWPLPYLCLAGIGLGAVAGVVVELVAVKPLRKRVSGTDQLSEATFLSTVAVMLIVGGLNIRETGGGRYQSFPESKLLSGAIDVGPVTLQRGYVVSAAVAVVVVIGCALVFNRTQVGRSLRAIAADQDMATLLGIDVARYSAGAAAVAGGLAGLAGVLLAGILTSFDIGFGDTFLLKGFAIVVLAGLGRVGGVLLGGIILGVTETMLGYFGASGWSVAGSMALIALILMVKPNGLFGRVGVERA